MVAFHEKSLDDRTIGDALRAAREERGETYEDIERATRISKKFVAALETGDLKVLPEPVYARKFVRALALHYGIDPDAAAEGVMRELAVASENHAARHPVNFVEGRSLMATPKLFKTLLIAGGFLAVLIYFGASVVRILTPPKVTLRSPHDAEVFQSGRVVLEGDTEPGVDLAVNGETVPIGQDGSFSDVLTLPPGVSDLRLSAKKKHSRESQIFLKVVVDEPAVDASASATPEVTDSASDIPATTPAPKPKPKPKPEPEPETPTEDASSTPA